MNIKSYLKNGRILLFILIPIVVFSLFLAQIYLGVVAGFFTAANLKSITSLCLSTNHVEGDCYCLDEPSLFFYGIIYFLLMSPLSADWIAKKLGYQNGTRQMLYLKSILRYFPILILLLLMYGCLVDPHQH